jgi:hypothetical protein
VFLHVAHGLLAGAVEQRINLDAEGLVGVDLDHSLDVGDRDAGGRVAGEERFGQAPLDQPRRDLAELACLGQACAVATLRTTAT